MKPIKTLLPMACDGNGPSQTCIRILDGASESGFPVILYANRRRVSTPRYPCRFSIGRWPFTLIPYRAVSRFATWRTESDFLKECRPGDVCFVWPAASLSVHTKLAEAGCKVIMEAINSRMKSAKIILDKAYTDFGALPAHGITDQRIQEEEEKYRLSTAIFAPNSCVESALQDTPLADSILRTSYGADTSRARSAREFEEKAQLTFLFCGYASVRKGIHIVFEAWKKLSGNHRLRLVGGIEPIIRERYKDLLASERVELVGFVDDVHEHYRHADVFIMPSFEEGGPQVTYEAAIHGLPIIASSMGSSRLGEADGTMLILDEINSDFLLEAMEKLVESVELRRYIGDRARHASFDYDWRLVGARRAELLVESGFTRLSK